MITPFDLHWQAPEFEERDRDISWYWISIIIAAALIAFAVWQRNFLFGIFILIAEVLVIVWAGRLPRMIDFDLNDQGLVLNGAKHYRLSEFENFSAVEIPHDIWSELVLHFKGRFRPSLIIKIPHAHLTEARKYLRTGMKEVEHEPSFIESIEKLIGF